MQVAQFANCSLRCRLNSGWEPETRDHELPTLWLAKGTKMDDASQVDGLWEQERRTQEKERDLCEQRL